jgi:hypothetical protein
MIVRQAKLDTRSSQEADKKEADKKKGTQNLSQE